MTSEVTIFSIYSAVACAHFCVHYMQCRQCMTQSRDHCCEDGDWLRQWLRHIGLPLMCMPSQAVRRDSQGTCLHWYRIAP